MKFLFSEFMSLKFFPRQTLKPSDDEFPPWELGGGGVMEAKQNSITFLGETEAFESKYVL